MVLYLCIENEVEKWRDKVSIEDFNKALTHLDINYIENAKNCIKLILEVYYEKEEYFVNYIINYF